jgi:hypothetical protein
MLRETGPSNVVLPANDILAGCCSGLAPNRRLAAPMSQVSASEAFLAAKGAVTDFEHFCERQQEACVVGSRTAVTLGQRAQAGAKMLYEFLSERVGSNESRSVRTTDSVPLPQPRPDK